MNSVGSVTIEQIKNKIHNCKMYAGEWWSAFEWIPINTNWIFTLFFLFMFNFHIQMQRDIVSDILPKIQFIANVKRKKECIPQFIYLVKRNANIMNEYVVDSFVNNIPCRI